MAEIALETANRVNITSVPYASEITGNAFCTENVANEKQMFVADDPLPFKFDGNISPSNVCDIKPVKKENTSL